jgi:hypothetical protein
VEAVEHEHVPPTDVDQASGFVLTVLELSLLVVGQGNPESVSDPLAEGAAGSQREKQ